MRGTMENDQYNARKEYIFFYIDFQANVKARVACSSKICPSMAQCSFWLYQEPIALGMGVGMAQTGIYS
jgi:hypothetical protein